MYLLNNGKIQVKVALLFSKYLFSSTWKADRRLCVYVSMLVLCVSIFCVCVYVSCMSFYILVYLQNVCKSQGWDKPSQEPQTLPWYPMWEGGVPITSQLLTGPAICIAQAMAERMLSFRKKPWIPQESYSKCQEEKTEPRNPCLGETSLSNVKEKSSHSQKNKTQTFVGLPIRKPKMSHSSGNERLGDINVNPHKEIKKPN